MLKDDRFARSLTSATANIDTLPRKLNSGEGAAGKLMTDPELFNRLNSATERLDQWARSCGAGWTTSWVG